MFQNINENTIDMESKKEDAKEKVNIFANVFTKNNILLYIVSFIFLLLDLEEISLYLV